MSDLENHVLDQKPVVYDGEQESLFSYADRSLGQSLEDGSLDSVAETLRMFRTLGRDSSLAAAKMLHGVNNKWMSFEHEEGDTFAEWAVRETGYSKETVKRAVGLWEFVTGHYIPPQFHKRITEHTIQQLQKEYSVRVTPESNGKYYDFVREDCEITDKQWLALAEAPDTAGVVAVVDKIKGRKGNKNRMSVKIMDDGNVWVHQGKKSKRWATFFVGDDDELVQKMIRRAKDALAITEQNEY